MLFGTLSLALATSLAQQPTTKFGTPEQVRADALLAGIGRRYPSPVMHDVDGDGLADLVLGDLYGAVTVSKRLAGEGPPRFGPEMPLLASDGTELVFNNW